MDALTRRIALRRTVALSVAARLHAGVSLVIEGQCFTVGQALRGPVKIFLDDRRQVVYKQGDGPASLLTDVARVSAA